MNESIDQTNGGPPDKEQIPDIAQQPPETVEQQKTLDSPSTPNGSTKNEILISIIRVVGVVVAACIAIVAAYFGLKTEIYKYRIAVIPTTAPTATATLTPTHTPTATATPTPTHIPTPVNPWFLPTPSINPWPEETTGKVSYVREKVFYIGELDEDQTQLINPTLISEINHSFGNPRMAPDGSKIAFSSQYQLSEDIYTGEPRKNPFSQIYRNDPRTSDRKYTLTNVSHGPFYTNDYSAWSPDGSKILFTVLYSPVGMGGLVMDLVIVDSNGIGPKKTVVNNKKTRVVQEACDKLETCTDLGDCNDFENLIDQETCDNLETMIDQECHIDGQFDSGFLNIHISQTPFSPDGKKIVYSSTTCGTYDLWIVNSDGTDRMPLTNDPRHNEKGAVLSPDGNMVAYQQETLDGTQGEIFFLDVSRGLSAVPINLTNNVANDYDPTWSSDGTKLLFISDRSGYRDIYMMNIDGTGVTNLTNTIENEDNPRWLP